MFTEEFFLGIHYSSIVLSVLVPLYYWYIKKDKKSPVLRVARIVRVLNALFYLAATIFVFEVFRNDLALGAPLFIAMPLFAYLLARRWAPRKHEEEIA